MGKAVDRTFRSLRGLEKTASTSRVLNLSALLARNTDNPDHQKSPIFVASSLGGRTIFVAERGWLDVLDELRGEAPDLARDIGVLEAIDELPSLDPFLLREHMKRRGFEISPSYFEISAPDLTRMQRFVGSEITKLIELAYRDVTGGMESNTTRLVEALLSAKTDARLEPLRLTLRLEPENYKEGIFAWKGFLYYKWVLNSLWPDLKEVFAELGKVRVIGQMDRQTAMELEATKGRLRTKLERQVKTVMGHLNVYDETFAQLTGEGNAIAFRDFLLKSPDLFLSLGEGCGLISHIVTYWRYQFARGKPLYAGAVQLVDILQDFEASLGTIDDLAEAT